MISVVVAALACVAALAFVVSYSFVHWESSGEGRNAMSVTLIVALIAAARVIRLMDTPDHEVLEAATDVLWVGVAAVMIRRLFLFIAAQHDREQARRNEDITP